jgi:phosphohistidine phosphatase
MLLYLLRHADAIQTPVVHDRERALSDPGFRQAAIVAKFLDHQKEPPATIISSPYLRAVQTAESIRMSLTNATISHSDYLIPGSRHQDLFTLLDQHPHHNTLLVSHEPHLSQILALLTAGQTRIGIEFKKCSLASIEVEHPIRPGAGMLRWLITVKQMEAMER